MRQLQQAKTAFPDVRLIVGVTGDRETHRRKGLTVLSAAERAESVRHCKWVDEVIEDCPWVVTPEFLEKHSLDYVAHDDIPYGAAEGDDIYGAIKAEGRFLVTQRTEGVSTTGIITKIVRDYESYIARQLQRGQSRKELNISWLKKNELDLKRHFHEMRESIKHNWATTGQELGKDFRQFLNPSGASRPGSPGLVSADSFRGRRSDPNSSGASPVTPGPASLRSARSPGAWSRFSVGRDRDFAAGYAMGLLGSGKGWVSPHPPLYKPRISLTRSRCSATAATSATARPSRTLAATPTARMSAATRAGPRTRRTATRRIGRWWSGWRPGSRGGTEMVISRDQDRRLRKGWHTD